MQTYLLPVFVFYVIIPLYRRFIKEYAMKRFIKGLLIFLLIINILYLYSCSGNKASDKNAVKDAVQSFETAGDVTGKITEADTSAEAEETDPQEILPAISYTDIMIDVPYISQEGILPNGCEAVSCVMLLRYYGFEVDALDFARNRLVKDIFIRDGENRVFGPDPEVYYAGDPEQEKGGFGCYPPALQKSLEGYLSSEYSALDLSGMTLDELISEYLSNNIPVALWLTVDMQKTQKFVHWYDKAEIGNENPREILYPANLHVLVLCGFDGENFIFADPYESRGIVSYSYENTVEIYGSMGKRAFAITKNF